jgi:dihydroxy-acid dehydratase
LVREGDEITIDAAARRIDLGVTEAELASRQAVWKQPEPRYTQGALAKYARVVGSAEHGALTW